MVTWSCSFGPLTAQYIMAAGVYAEEDHWLMEAQKDKERQEGSWMPISPSGACSQ